MHGLSRPTLHARRCRISQAEPLQLEMATSARIFNHSRSSTRCQDAPKTEATHDHPDNVSMKHNTTLLAVSISCTLSAVVAAWAGRGMLAFLPGAGTGLLAWLLMAWGLNARAAAEPAPVQSERRMRRVLQLAPIGIAELGAAGTWLRVNKALCEFLGYDPATLRALPLNELDGDREAPVSAYLRAGLEGRPMAERQTFQFRCQDGTLRWAEVSGVPTQAGDAMGKRRFIAIIKDVDEAYRARQVLVDAERHFREIADAAPLMIWQSDARGQLTYFNRAWGNLVYAQGPPPTRPRWTDSIHPEDRLFCERLFQSALTQKQPMALDCRLRSARGDYRWVTLVAEPQYRDRGFAGFIATGVDITERKGHEQRVMASERRLRGVTASIPGLVFELLQHLVSGRWSLRYASDGALDLLHCHPGELMQDFNRFLRCFEGQAIEGLLAQLAAAADQGEASSQHEIQLATPGQPWVEIRVSISRERETRVFAGLILDINERKVQAARLSEAAGRIRQLSNHNLRVKEDERQALAREMHDEFGQLLTAMSMDVRMIALRLPAELTGIQEDLKRLQEMIATTVAASRRIIADLRPPAVDLGLDAAIEWLAADLRKRHGIACRLDLPAGPVKVPEAVSVQLFRVLQETLTNVAKHAGAGRVMIALEQHRDRLVLRVSDDGRGFEPVTQHGRYGLLGIQERMQLLGGEAVIESQPGHGTRIRVRVPLAASPADEPGQ